VPRAKTTWITMSSQRKSPAPEVTQGRIRPATTIRGKGARLRRWPARGPRTVPAAGVSAIRTVSAMSGDSDLAAAHESLGAEQHDQGHGDVDADVRDLGR